jgi:hypothetical protein
MEMEPDLVIHIYGDTAVCSAEFTLRVRENGQVNSRRSRPGDIFVKTRRPVESDCGTRHDHRQVILWGFGQISSLARNSGSVR